jgi:hypothetical protein
MSMNLPLINNYITTINNDYVTKIKNDVLLVCKTCNSKIMVENNGFEPLTPCVQGRCSSQLS